MKNRIYFFTGTGNSFRIAKKIEEKIQDCEVIAVTETTDLEIPENYDRIGFVFPVYFQGMPKIFMDFLEHAKFAKQEDTYYFAVATYGATHGIAIAQINNLLHKKGIQLNYGKNLKMFSNYVALYNMSTKVEAITKKSEEEGDLVVSNILEKKRNHNFTYNKIIGFYYQKQINSLSKADFNFSVSDNCISCGRCAAVCASKNIIIKEGLPTFQHHCNQCMACLQFCPQKAINYKKNTQKRRRYIHPKVNYKELIQYYK